MNDTNLKLFLKKISQNAPLGDGYFYPYKPALIIAIFLNYDSTKLFNQDVLINDKVLKTYYNLIIDDVFLYEKLTKQKSKEKLKIFLGFNNYLKKNFTF